MCGRFVSMSDSDGIVRFFTVDDRQADDIPPSWNVAPTSAVYAIVDHNGRRVLVAFRWGLIPSWAKDRSVGARMINARSETAAEKPAFRTALARRRCLIPADGFYEWTIAPDGSKQPHLIHHAGGTQLALAGLWETWRDPADEQAPPVRSCTILTTAAQGPMTELHHRMPVVLDRERWTTWLDLELDDAAAAQALLDEAEPPPLRHHLVSPEVNSARNDHPDLLRPIAESQRPPPPG